jgi:phage/plasmid-like protein (TIGR03299 family)
MAHGLTESDSMFSVRSKPWHGLGVVLEEAPASIGEALEKAGLDWEVAKVPVYYTPAQAGEAPNPEAFSRDIGEGETLRPVADSGKTEAENERDEIVVDPNPGLRDVRLTIRTDTGEPLGVVSKWYEEVQNREAFSFLADLIGSELHFETAGSILGGRRVWVLVKVPEWVTIGGDTVETYLLVETRHDGKGAVRVVATVVRVVCQNTLRAALSGAKQTYTVHHLGDPTKRLAEARAALDVTIDYAKQFKEFGDRLASEKVTDQKVRAVLGKMYPTTDEMTDRQKKARVKTRDEIVDLFRNGETVGNSPGTKWALANAICEYVDFYGGRSLEGEALFRRTQEANDGIKRQAFDLVAN